MSFTPDVSPVFMYTNNADFTVPSNTTSYMPSNLNSLYPTSETSYDSSTNYLNSNKCVCNFDFWGTNTIATDTSNMNHYLDRVIDLNADPITYFSIYGRNTSPYKGIGARLEDNITNVGDSAHPLRISFARGTSSGTVTIHQYRAFFCGVSLA